MKTVTQPLQNADRARPISATEWLRPGGANHAHADGIVICWAKRSTTGSSLEFSPTPAGVRLTRESRAIPIRTATPENDRLPGYNRNALLDPDYAITELRVRRRFLMGEHLKLDLSTESFNLFNRDHQPVHVTDDGFQNAVAEFTLLSKTIGISHFPAYFQRSLNFMKATNAYAPRHFNSVYALRFEEEA